MLIFSSVLIGFYMLTSGSYVFVNRSSYSDCGPFVLFVSICFVSILDNRKPY